MKDFWEKNRKKHKGAFFALLHGRKRVNPWTDKKYSFFAVSWSFFGFQQRVTINYQGPPGPSMTHFGTYFLTYFLTYKSLVIWLFHFWKVFKPSLLFHKFIKNIQYTIRRMYCTAGLPFLPTNLFWRFWMRSVRAHTIFHPSFMRDT